MTTREAIGQRIREAREELGLSQSDLGRLMSRQRTHAAVSELERGKVRLGAEELAEIAAVLKKDVSYFYDTHDAPTPTTSPSVVYRRGERGLESSHQRQTDRAIENFKQYAREQAKLRAKKLDL